MPIDHLDWEYDPSDDDYRAWTPTSCFGLLLLLVLFWGLIIGGGIWISNTF